MEVYSCEDIPKGEIWILPEPLATAIRQQRYIAALTGTSQFAEFYGVIKNVGAPPENSHPTLSAAREFWEVK